jgi:hypothetical protein
MVSRQPTTRRTWALAVLATLALHVLLALLLNRARFPALASAEPPDPPPLEVTFAPERPQPKRFTEQPAEREDEAPESPDALSNVNARARDAFRGEDNVPRQDGPGETPEFPMEQAAPPSEPHPEPRDATDPADESTPAPHPPTDDAESAGARELVMRSPDTPVTPARPSAEDLAQLAAKLTEAGAQLDGDFSLSTVAWDYAPWMIAFRRAVVDRWNPPSAYFMGLIHGWVVAELEVARDGSLVRVNVLEDDVGHRSLTSAAMNALERAAPYRPLPRSFPEETLVIRLRFTYPRLRP